MHNTDLITKSWSDYELLDSGANRKLERFGQYIVIRPETQALWSPAHPAAWKNPDAEFKWFEGKGVWEKRNAIDPSTVLSWNNARFTMRLTSFKHTGIFPEQAANWEWIAEQVGKVARRVESEDQRLDKSAPKQSRQGKPKILNLFGYTGIASIVAALHGAEVTHVDASKQSNLWARENAELSGLPEDSIRYILEDAPSFAERESRRGILYDGIILDPPAFGRGAKREVWKIEEGLPELLAILAKLLSPKKGSFFLLNGYAAGYSPDSFAQAVESTFPEEKGEFGELGIAESGSKRVVPSGIYTRFVR